MSLLAVLALLPPAALAACGQGPADDDALARHPTAAPDALVLQVVRAGGFLPVGTAFRSVPSVSVYADGRVVTEGPQIEIWPPPALPSVQVGRLDADEVRRLVDGGRELVDAQEDYGQPPVADAPTTAVVVEDGGSRAVAAAVALDELAGELAPPDGGGLTAEQRAARERLSAYVREVRTRRPPPRRRSTSRRPWRCSPSRTATPPVEGVRRPSGLAGPALARDVRASPAQATEARGGGVGPVETAVDAAGRCSGCLSAAAAHEQTCEDVQEQSCAVP
jgi:hypothetical protein